jgi:hypothetical protein
LWSDRRNFIWRRRSKLRKKSASTSRSVEEDSNVIDVNERQSNKHNVQSTSTHAGRSIVVRSLGANDNSSIRSNLEENSNGIDGSDLHEEKLIRMNAMIDDEIRNRKNMIHQVMPEWTL